MYGDMYVCHNILILHRSADEEVKQPSIHNNYWRNDVIDL